MLLSGKRFLISGVANHWSIAWGAAKAIASEGGELGFICLGDRAKLNIADLCKVHEINPAFIIACDVASDEQLEAMAREVGDIWKGFDGFLHSLAHAKKENLQGKYYSVSREGFAHALDISVYSLTAMVRLFQPIMREGASVVTLSYLGAERAVENYNIMGVAKAALEASVRYLARDLGEYRIRVNAVSPGAIKTLSARGISDFNSLLDYFNSRVLLGEDVNPESVAGTIVYLLSDLSRPVTGEVIHVDAGFHIVA